MNMKYAFEEYFLIYENILEYVLTHQLIPYLVYIYRPTYMAITNFTLGGIIYAFSLVSR